MLDLETFCDEKTSWDVEHAIYHCMEMANVKWKLLKKYYDLRGICGTNGRRYNNSSKVMFAKNIMVGLGLFTRKKYNTFQKGMPDFMLSHYPDLFW
ncbi:MAG: hypothetical protein K6G85_07395 [Eubacterium sp.]|nr:hypothetical protein [Eubacterium sp.]